MTDDSGGRTEVVRSTRDLDPATASIADELSKQYYLGYPSQRHKDGRWHTIRVDHVVDNHLMKLRRKLPTELGDKIQSVPGKGYRYFE